MTIRTNAIKKRLNTVFPYFEFFVRSEKVGYKPASKNIAYTIWVSRGPVDFRFEPDLMYEGNGTGTGKTLLRTGEISYQFGEMFMNEVMKAKPTKTFKFTIKFAKPLTNGAGETYEVVPMHNWWKTVFNPSRHFFYRGIWAKRNATSAPFTLRDIDGSTLELFHFYGSENFKAERVASPASEATSIGKIDILSRIVYKDPTIPGRWHAVWKTTTDNRHVVVYRGEETEVYESENGFSFGPSMDVLSRNTILEMWKDYVDSKKES